MMMMMMMTYIVQFPYKNGMTVQSELKRNSTKRLPTTIQHTMNLQPIHHWLDALSKWGSTWAKWAISSLTRICCPFPITGFSWWSWHENRVNGETNTDVDPAISYMLDFRLSKGMSLSAVKCKIDELPRWLKYNPWKQHNHIEIMLWASHPSGWVEVCLLFVIDQKSHQITKFHLNIMKNPMFDSRFLAISGALILSSQSLPTHSRKRPLTVSSCFVARVAQKQCIRITRIGFKMAGDRIDHGRQIWPTVAEITNHSNGCDSLKAKRNDKPLQWASENTTSASMYSQCNIYCTMQHAARPSRSSLCSRQWHSNPYLSPGIVFGLTQFAIISFTQKPPSSHIILHPPLSVNHLIHDQFLFHYKLHKSGHFVS